MQRFEPSPGMQLEIHGSTFVWMPDALFPEDDVVFARQGSEAVLYQLQEQSTAALWALKRFHPGYVFRDIPERTATISRHAALPGLSSARRWCLSRNTFSDAVSRYPALEYAVLMPWIEGRTWSGMLLDRRASERYTPERARALARSLAHCLGNLEAHGLAHTDIAGSNILLNQNWNAVELVDLDRMYLPDLPSPAVVSCGSPGYAFPHLDASGQWCPQGDRFAGAIILVEMLAWADPLVRQHTPLQADTLFDDNELQSLTSERWQLARDAVWSMCPPALDLFDQAWSARDLQECPPLAQWADALDKSGPPAAW